MERLTTTHFGRRPMTAGQILAMKEKSEAPAGACDKWALFRALCKTKDTFGIKDRDLTVLNALLSFLPVNDMAKADGLIVFPSNATLCARAHGIAESTLRRHIAKLCDAGLITRHDSPNGKRYAKRGVDGKLVRAFGFDLAPFARQKAIIENEASEAEQERERIAGLKEKIVLRLRDAVHVLELSGQSDVETQIADVRKILRRKASKDVLITTLETLENITTKLEMRMADAGEMSACDNQNERHIIYSNTNTNLKETHRQEHSVKLYQVIEICTELKPYLETPPKDWRQFFNATNTLRPMLGINVDIWTKAQTIMGTEKASIALACILQIYATLKNPNGYLRTLVKQAQKGKFKIERLLARAGQSPMPAYS